MQGLLWDQQFHETINLNTDSYPRQGNILLRRKASITN